MPGLEGMADTEEVWALYPTFSGGLAFDVGANAGQVADVLSNNFDRVVAFEPAVESMFDLERKQHRNVTPVRAAVSDHSGTVELLWNQRATGRFGQLASEVGFDLIGHGGDSRMIEVPAVTLDEAVAEYGAPDFIKVDVEGHEVKVIQGGRNLFQDYDPTLLIEIHADEYGKEIVGLLPGYKWERYGHPEHSGIENDPRASESRKARTLPRWAKFVKNHYWIRGTR